MFRQIASIGHMLACVESLANYRCIRFGTRIQTPRYFSSAMTANWPEAIKKFLEKQNISQPSLIQERTLPIVMENKNLVGVARTGSGKTLAFVIPAVMKILGEREAENSSAVKIGSLSVGDCEKLPTCLILAPTRELASQTADVFAKFKYMGIRSIVLVGGASRDAQLNQLAYRDQDVYIATPGRLLDLIESNSVNLSNIKYLVLDEADRMLDMGFEPQIRSILEKSQIPNDCQTLMWSATWPKEIQNLARDFMNGYEYVAVDSEKLKANPNIKQVVAVCRPFDKLNLTLDHLEKFEKEHDSPKVLVFVNTKRMADQLMFQFSRHRRRAVTMHGDRSQRQRDEALRLFKKQDRSIMIATDVAARGLDINDITHVINYDFPHTIEDYIHRIGRTARHTKIGTSLSFFTSNDSKLASRLISVLEETNQEVPPKLATMQDSVLPRREEEFTRKPSSVHRRNYGGQSYTTSLANTEWPGV